MKIEMSESPKPQKPNRAKPVIRSTMRMASVPLNQIEVHPVFGSRGNESPLPDLLVADGALDLVSLLRPPVLIPAPGKVGVYLAIGNLNVIEWRQRIANFAETPDTDVLSLIIDTVDFDVAALASTERYLLPLVLGLLSKREEREARRQLKIAGNVRLKPTSIRARLTPIRRK